MSLFSICFAVYNNEHSLRALYERTIDTLEKSFPTDSFELIFVNDGSSDGSLAELIRIKQEFNDSRIKIIDFSRNFGQMAAILAGWDQSTGECSVNLAADLQDPPEQIAKMIEVWKQGVEIVISYRDSHKTSFINKLSSRAFYRLLLPNVPPGGFDFVLLGRNALHAMRALKERNRFYQFDILWLGFSRAFIPYDKLERMDGKSQYTFFKRLSNFLIAFINVSYFPIRAMGFVGIALSVSGIIYCASIIHAYFVHNTPFLGWAPIMVVLLLIGGMIMFMLSVIGEYVWRILDETKRRPTYIIRKVQ